MTTKKTTAKTTAKTKAGYKVPEGETGSVHLIIHKKEFDPLTGKPLHKRQKFKTTPTGYLQFLEYRQGFEIEEVLHLPAGVKTPEEWAKAKEEAAKKKASRN